MEGIRKNAQIPIAVLAGLIFAGLEICVCAQDSEKSGDSSATASLSGEALTAYLSAQIALLDSPEFRTRELAKSRLLQYPHATIPIITRTVPNTSLNAAAQQIEILDRFLSYSDDEIKTYAYEVLKSFSQSQTTAIGSLAVSSVKGIEDDFERQAFELLTNAGASVGYLNININGSRILDKNELMGIEIKPDEFTGDAETLNWMRYLKSARVVSLEGDFACAETLTLVAQMPNVKKILLRGTYRKPGVYDTKLKPSDLLILKSLPEIEHFEVKYMSIDDSFVPVLCQLPITESLRLFGTGITEMGKQEIAKKLDGLEIYRGGGGFLGITSSQLGQVVVSDVQTNSAAANAGIQPHDIILEIDGKPIKNFPALRATLANYMPNEMLVMKIKRRNPPTSTIEFAEYQLFVVLNEQAN